MTSKSVESLLEDIRLLNEARYDTVQAVRAVIRKAVHPLGEEVKYGGILFSSGVAFGGVFAYEHHVAVEFSKGAAITDTLGHLEGTGKLRRHVKLGTAADVDGKRLIDYVPLALQAARGAT